MPSSATPHGRNDGALRPTRDMGLESSLTDPLDDVLDLLLSSVVGHIYDHGFDNPFSVFALAKEKAAICSRPGWRT
jgi:hypothetical protein